MFIIHFVFIALISQNVFPADGKYDPNLLYNADSVITHTYDVLHYDLDIEFYPPFDTLSGKCTMIAKAMQHINSIPLHLGYSMSIDSIILDGAVTTYSRVYDTIDIHMPWTDSNDIFTVTTYYRGYPAANGFYRGNNGFYTLVEVQEASKQWWPCFDFCWDKSDAGIDLHFTVPDTIYAVTNGNLISIDTLSGNRLTYNWEHNYPIATYLVSVAGYNYTVIERTFHGYPLVYYAIPGNENWANMMLDSTEVVMTLFDTLIDTFPFATEKLGQYQIIGGGGMEHQTCILYGNAHWANPITHAHELGHSWWGDAVTCINYNNMFMNEGTTSYYECLGTYALRGEDGYKQRLTDMRAGALGWDDTYHWTVINSVHPFGLNVYWKGAWFHHMLRNLIGDTLYFPAMKDFYHTHRGGNVSVTDLQDMMEVYYQDSLGWFFHQWLKETDYPYLDISCSYSDDTVDISIEQIQTTGFIFRIPVEFGFWSGASLETKGPFWMDDSILSLQVYSSYHPDSITVDPNLKLYFRYILDYVGVEEIAEKPIRNSEHSLNVSYLPNGVISFNIISPTPSELYIYDLSGRIIQSWVVNADRTIEWNGMDSDNRILPGGRYFSVIRGYPAAHQIILLK